MSKIIFLKSAISQKGGLEKYCKALMQGFRSRGDCVVLLTTDSQDDSGLEGIEVVDFGKRSKCSLYHLLHFDRQCQKYLKNNSFDVVFGFDRNFCLQTHYRAGNGVHAAYLDMRKRTSSLLKRVSLQINPLHRVILQMEKQTFESPDLRILFCNSNMIKSEILKYYPKVDVNKIKVVHNGVEWNTLSQNFEKGFSERNELMKHYALDPTCMQFLFIGHEYKRKGLVTLLQALSSLKEKTWQLSVVGKERSMKTFSDLAKRLGVQENVIFFGQQKEVLPFYQVADCFVLPSMYDPFANVTLEALAMGLFTVTTSSNGASEVITENSGYIAKDPLSVAEFGDLLQKTFQRKKTKESATRIRNSVQYLDFSNQINAIIEAI